MRHLHCGLGVCVTASHNPAEYNGYKVYGADGCQMTPEAAKRVVALLEHMDYFSSAKTMDFDAALAAGSIRYIPDGVLDAFVDAVYAQRVGSGEGIANLKLVYTPLNGAGLECVKKLTQKLGIRNMTIVKEQEQPDGHFPTCPYPNPEIRQAMELGLQYCDRVRPDILIGTDPDCDRCGTAVPDGKGGYRLISGNEMGVILLDFICRSRIANGTMPENPVAVTTIVSTDMVTAVAKNTVSNCGACSPALSISANRSRCWSRAAIRNAISSALRKATGISPARMRAIRTRLTPCFSSARLLRGMRKGYDTRRCHRRAVHGVRLLLQHAEKLCIHRRDGHGKMAGLMQGLRKQPLREIAGLPVEGYTDYEAEGTGLPKANVLEYRLPGGDKVIIRPSGTEPKIKAYLSAVKPTVEESNAQLSLLAEAAAKLLA